MKRSLCLLGLLVISVIIFSHKLYAAKVDFKLGVRNTDSGITLQFGSPIDKDFTIIICSNRSISRVFSRFIFFDSEGFIKKIHVDNTPPTRTMHYQFCKIMCDALDIEAKKCENDTPELYKKLSQIVIPHAKACLGVLEKPGNK